MNKAFLNISFLIVTMIVLTNSATAQIGNFFSWQTVPKDSIVKKYVVLQDGTTIYGEHVDLGGVGFGIIVIIDKQRYKVSEVKYVQLGQIRGSNFTSRLYTNVDNELYETFVMGRHINVYFLSDMQAFRRHHTKTHYYYEKPGQEILPLGEMEDLATAIGDCKLTGEIKNMDRSDLKAAVKENSRYLNELFEKYNRSCK